LKLWPWPSTKTSLEKKKSLNLPAENGGFQGQGGGEKLQKEGGTNRKHGALLPEPRDKGVRKGGARNKKTNASDIIGGSI